MTAWQLRYFSLPLDFDILLGEHSYLASTSSEAITSMQNLLNAGQNSSFSFWLQSARFCVIYRIVYSGGGQGGGSPGE